MMTKLHPDDLAELDALIEAIKDELAVEPQQVVLG
jgi:hypothetical protein